MPKRLLPNRCETESIDDSDSDYVVSDGESITVTQPRLGRTIRELEACLCEHAWKPSELPCWEVYLLRSKVGSI